MMVVRKGGAKEKNEAGSLHFSSTICRPSSRDLIMDEEAAWKVIQFVKLHLLILT